MSIDVHQRGCSSCLQQPLTLLRHSCSRRFSGRQSGISGHCVNITIVGQRFSLYEDVAKEKLYSHSSTQCSCHAYQEGHPAVALYLLETTSIASLDRSLLGVSRGRHDVRVAVVERPGCVVLHDQPSHESSIELIYSLMSRLELSETMKLEMSRGEKAASIPEERFRR